MALLKIVNYEDFHDCDTPQPIEVTISKKIDYVINPDSNKYNLYGGFNFVNMSNSHAIADQFISLSSTYYSRNFVPVQHIILSLDPLTYEDNTTPEQLALIVHRFCKYTFGNDYQVIWGIHNDEVNLHAHIVINTVNIYAGTLLPWNKQMMNVIYNEMAFVLKLNSYWKGAKPITKLIMVYSNSKTGNSI